MSIFALLKKRMDGGNESPSASQLSALQRELEQYLAGRTEDLAADAASLQGLYHARRLCEALDLQQEMAAQTATLTTLVHIAELLDACLAAPLPNPPLSTYAVSPLFLAGLINRLLPAEKMALLSGTQLAERLFTIDTGVPLRAQASATHISPTAESRAAAINFCWQAGCTLHVIAHTHPGNTAQAVWPSNIDTDTLARLQQSHYPIIGLVACEGGFFRAYSDHQPFALRVAGEGVEELNSGSHLYRVSPELLAQAGKLDTFVSPLAVRAV